jgi:hypothetical protein
MIGQRMNAAPRLRAVIRHSGHDCSTRFGGRKLSAISNETLADLR